MFIFEVGDATLRVTVDDTRRVRLLAVVCGLLELAPDDIAAKLLAAAKYLRDSELCTAEQFRRVLLDGLGTSATDSQPARAFFDALFNGIAAGTGGVARLIDVVIAVALLLSGARKSEKLAFAFDAVKSFENGGEGELDEAQIARIFAAILCAILAASGEFASASGTTVARVALRAASDLSEHVVAGGGTLSFDEFGQWYNSSGFESAPWLELLDLSKWPAPPTAEDDNEDDVDDESVDDEEDDEKEDDDDDDDTLEDESTDEQDSSRWARPRDTAAVVAFDVATEDDGELYDDGEASSRARVLSASFSSLGVARVRAMVIVSGLAECDASVLCAALRRAAGVAGRVDLSAFADVVSTLCDLDLGQAAGESSDAAAASRKLLRYLHAAFSARDARLGADASELAAGLALLCAGSKSAKLAVAWEVLADASAAADTGRDAGVKYLSRRGLWRYLRAFLLALISLAAIPDPAADASYLDDRLPTSAGLRGVLDDADAAAVTLAAQIFRDVKCGDAIKFDDFADWYTDGGFKTASWLELLDLGKWVL
mmetsp:Transcript_1943/g.5827  ORF Transcript_1943/g.5827 Transcript_1943/m.5827 type:complete len:544 (+) Transcript_1943:90-1721(+)